MSQDPKLQDVPIASYVYRHEAEFAAGFLAEAGIAYVLHVEDATMGVTATGSATLWVRGMDVRAACEVLDIPEPRHRPRAVSAGPREETPLTGKAVAEREAGYPTPIGGTPITLGVPLTTHERVVSTGLGLGGVPLVALLPASTPVFVVTAIAIAAVALVLSGLAGRTVKPIRSIVSALSGTAP